MIEEQKKCGHQTCRCLVPEGKNFCGPWCEGAKLQTERPICDCGHPACQESMTARE
jgi:hypothetical protein